MKLTQILLHQHHSEFERDFAREVLASERTRASILSAILIVIFIVTFSLNLIFGDQIEVNQGLRYLWLLIEVVAIAYELATRHFFGLFIRLDRQPPAIARYGNALFETSLPTIGIGLLSTFIDPVQALINPVSFFYILFICPFFGAETKQVSRA